MPQRKKKRRVFCFELLQKKFCFVQKRLQILQETKPLSTKKTLWVTRTSEALVLQGLKNYFGNQTNFTIKSQKILRIFRQIVTASEPKLSVMMDLESKETFFTFADNSTLLKPEMDIYLITGQIEKVTKEINHVWNLGFKLKVHF